MTSLNCIKMRDLQGFENLEGLKQKKPGRKTTGPVFIS